jgi:AcrR family transcriptional regulator
MSTRPRRTLPARAERRDEIRLALLQSIEALVGDGSTLAEVTVERLATRAGISRAKFYVYFEDKADVLRAWFQVVNEELTQATAAWWQIGPASEKADLRAVFVPMLAAYRPHLTLMAAVHDTALYDVSIREEFAAFMDRHIGELTEHIRAGQAAGFIATELPAPQTAAWLAVMAERMQRTIAADATEGELERHLQTYVDIVWGTLYA